MLCMLGVRYSILNKINAVYIPSKRMQFSCTRKFTWVENDSYFCSEILNFVVEHEQHFNLKSNQNVIFKILDFENWEVRDILRSVPLLSFNKNLENLPYTLTVLRRKGQIAMTINNTIQLHKWLRIYKANRATATTSRKCQMSQICSDKKKF